MASQADLAVLTHSLQLDSINTALSDIDLKVEIVLGKIPSTRVAWDSLEKAIEVAFAEASSESAVKTSGRGKKADVGTKENSLAARIKTSEVFQAAATWDKDDSRFSHWGYHVSHKGKLMWRVRAVPPIQ